MLIALFASAPARAEVVQAWNGALGQFFNRPGSDIPPHAQARAFAMMHLAMERAIVAGQAPARPIGGATTDLQLAANYATREVLTRAFPNSVERFDEIAAAQSRALAPEPKERERALAIGREAAEAVWSKREGDRWVELDPRREAVAALSAPLVVRSSGFYQAPKSPWLEAKPFVLKKVAQIEVIAPYWTDMEGRVLPNAGLARAKIFDSVDRGSSPAIAQFWSGSVVVAWNRVAGVLIERAGLDPASRARAYAAVNLAIADATLSSLHWRFTWGVWQTRWSQVYQQVRDAPMSTDVAAQFDDTGQLVMMRGEGAQILSPPVRNYPSTAATVAAAASTVLESVFGKEQAVFEVSPATAEGSNAKEPAARAYASPSSAARECAFASSLDGVHTREACVAGYRLGEAIGGYVAKQMRQRR